MLFSHPGSNDLDATVVYVYKYIKLQDKPVTKKEYQEAEKKWIKEKEESNKKAQEELEKHIK